MVVQDRQKFLLNLIHHPVCGAKVASRHFLDAAATPPGQEGRSLAPPVVLRVLPVEICRFSREGIAGSPVVL